MKPKNETTVLVLSLLITASLVGSGFWWFTNRGQTLDGLLPLNNSQSASGSRQERISLGDKILVKADTNPDKQAGVQAFARGDFATAVTKFQLSLQANRNDPEALIYLKLALALKTLIPQAFYLLLKIISLLPSYHPLLNALFFHQNLKF